MSEQKIRYEAKVDYCKVHILGKGIYAFAKYLRTSCLSFLFFFK